MKDSGVAALGGHLIELLGLDLLALHRVVVRQVGSTVDEETDALALEHSDLRYTVIWATQDGAHARFVEGESALALALSNLELDPDERLALARTSIAAPAGRVDTVELLGMKDPWLNTLGISVKCGSEWLTLDTGYERVDVVERRELWHRVGRAESNGEAGGLFKMVISSDVGSP